MNAVHTAMPSHLRSNSGQPCSLIETAELGVLEPLGVYIYSLGSESCPIRLVSIQSARLRPRIRPRWHLWWSSPVPSRGLGFAPARKSGSSETLPRRKLKRYCLDEYIFVVSLVFRRPSFRPSPSFSLSSTLDLSFPGSVDFSSVFSV